MPSLLAFFGLSFGLSLLLTPLARALAARGGLTDKPDQRRKLHGQTVPVAGGIAVLLASLATIALLLVMGVGAWEEGFFEQINQWLGLAAAAIIICCVGV